MMKTAAWASWGLLLASVLDASARDVSVPVAYEAPRDGYVSLALQAPSGELARSLLYAQPVKAGRQNVMWDGTDDLGRVCPPGDYSVRGIFFDQPPSLKYRMTVGRSGSPPYRTPDGKGDWGANLGQATGIAANHDSVMMVFACVEDNNITGLQRVDFDGNILCRYFSFYPWDQRTSAAMDDRQIYCAIYANEKLEIAAYKIDEPRGKILAALPVKPTVTSHGRWRNRTVSYTEGLALSDTTVYVSVPHANALCLVGRADGKVTKLDMPAPRGLAFHDGKLFTVSEKRLLRLSPNGVIEATLVDGGGLQNPSSLAVDAQGNLYVGDSGADLYREGTLVGGNRQANGGTCQIHVFSPHGKPLRRIGASGGSPREGRFNPDGFGDISGIAVDPEGRIWVNDAATGFKRNSLWSAAGKLLKQWFCRKIQHTADVVNPANPRELLSIRDIFDDAPPGIFAYEVDFAAGTWQPSWFYKPMRLTGIAGDCLFVSDALAMTWVWHKDGLYVGRLFPDTGTGVMDVTGIYVELMGNRIHEENGKLYTLVNDTGCAVHEVNLPAFTPLAASVRLSREEAGSAKPWDPDGPDPSLRPTFTVTRRDEPRHWPMKLDGEADGREGWFDGRTSPMILLDGQRLADVRALYDEQNLYLHYDIFTPTPFANVGTELPLCPFVSGAYVDFCVAPDWRRPQREKPQAGDARLILARVAGGGTDGNSGGNFAQGYWPVLPGVATGPTVIRSPAAETKFDRIGPVEGLQMMWNDHGVDGRSHLHRTKLEVYVPLAALGINGDPAGRSVGFDISVAVANQSGDRRERAMHWAGLSEGVVVDRPGSAELLPRTWGTLNFAPR